MQKNKPKLCRGCGSEFTPYNSTQITCSIQCALEYTNIKTDKKLKRDIIRSKALDRKELRQRKEALKSRSDHLREAQQQVNRYVRLRDSGRPCCSCDKPDDGTHQRHASHYRSIGACSALRFNLKNIHTSCQQCNTTHSGNLLEYRIRLIKRFGNKYVDFLESQNQITRYDIDYLKRLKKIFAKRCRMIVTT